MTPDVAEVVRQIDAVLARFEQVERECRQTGQLNSFQRYDYIEAPEIVWAEVLALLRSTLRRLSPDGNQRVADALEGIGESKCSPSFKMRLLAGALRALKADYLAGRLQTLREMVRSDVFSDFLEMAEYLLSDEGLKDPAAVMAGGVLEQHVRKLCDKHGVPTTFTDPKGNMRPKKLDTMNAELAKAQVYGGNDQKQVTAWAGIRNAAAHAEYDKYVAQQVVLMVQGVRDFMTRHPA